MLKLFFREDGTEALSRLVSGEQMATSRLSLVETASALCRRCRLGEISVAERDHLLEAIRQESRTFFLIDPTDEILRLAQDLLKRSSLRAADSIQLASALSLQRRGVLPLSFLCWDRRLQEAAALEGLFVHDFG